MVGYELIFINQLIGKYFISYTIQLLNKLKLTKQKVEIESNAKQVSMMLTYYNRRNGTMIMMKLILFIARFTKLGT